jgi:hypothetical protein
MLQSGTEDIPMNTWESDREHLKKQDYEITKRKIRKVAFTHDGKVMVAEVGKPSPHNGFPVRAIYEDGKRGIYLICAGGEVTMAGKGLVEEE